MIKLIVCLGKDGLIGDASPVGNGLLWHSKEELRHFNDKTKGGTLLFGKKTAEVVPIELIKKTRDVIVLDFGMNIDEIIEEYRNSPKTLWICGGLSIYKLFMAKGCLHELHISTLKPHVPVTPASTPLYFRINNDSGKYFIVNSIEYSDFKCEVWKNRKL